MCFFSSRRRHTRCALVTGVQSVLFRSFGGPPKRLRRFDGEHSQKPRPANVKRALLDDCAYAATWHGLEVLRHRNVDAMFLCAGHQCLRDRMFGIALDGCGHAKHLVIGESIGGSGLYDAMRTESERTCLVEHHRVQETTFSQAASTAYNTNIPRP